MHNKRKKNSLLKFLTAGGVLSIIAIGIIVGAMYLATMSDVITEQIILEKRIPTLVVGDAKPGDNSGYFYFMVYPHQAVPATAYASNLSNATAYEFSDSTNTSATGETPYSTTFDLVLKVGITNEDGQWTGNSTWNDNYAWLLLTCADLGIGADTNMTGVQIYNHSNYREMHYYLDNSTAGYTIIESQSFNITSAKYYVQRIT